MIFIFGTKLHDGTILFPYTKETKLYQSGAAQSLSDRHMNLTVFTKIKVKCATHFHRMCCWCAEVFLLLR